MFPQKRNENDLSVSVSAEIRSVRVTVQNVQTLNPEYLDYPDVRTDVRSIRTYTWSLRIVVRMSEQLSGVSWHILGVFGYSFANGSDQPNKMLKLVHILHINIAPITTTDNIKVRSKLTKPHYMKIHFSHNIVT